MYLVIVPRIANSKAMFDSKKFEGKCKEKKITRKKQKKNKIKIKIDKLFLFAILNLNYLF